MESIQGRVQIEIELGVCLRVANVDHGNHQGVPRITVAIGIARANAKLIVRRRWRALDALQRFSEDVVRRGAGPNVATLGPRTGGGTVPVGGGEDD